MKLERLNELNADDELEVNEVINIFNEIVGQIRGNPMIKHKCEPLLSKLIRSAEKPSYLTEARKRSLVSELREIIRHIDVQHIIDDYVGGNE